MIALLALLLASAAPDACAPDALRPSLEFAEKALAAKDLDAARRALAPAAACPVRDGITFVAHVLRADVAVRQGDWPTARAMLAGVGVHPENGVSGRAGFLRLRADQGLGDSAAFTADRDALIAADDRKLAANGGKVESFVVPGGRVDAYRTALDQGGFHRVYEFIVTPDDPAAYPVSIQLTDDQVAAQLIAGQGKGSKESGHAWFLDLYYCQGHSTLPPVAAPNAATPPDYATVKAVVQTTLADRELLKAAPPPSANCGGALWILPALGGTVMPPS